MSKIDITYHNLLNKILQEGYTYKDPNRKSVNRIEIPSYTFRHEFKDGFPAVSTKKLHYKNVVTELIWFLKGDTNIKYLVDNDCNIWNKDAYNYLKKNTKEDDCIPTYDWFITLIKEGNEKLGDLGPVYGRQWINFNGIDQISNLIKSLKEKPLGTEHIVNSWNVSDLPNMALPPCHYGFQVVVRPINNEVGINPQQWNLTTGEIKDLPKYGFELHWQQRSVDTFLGLPFNVASYATLALILEKITGHKALGIQGDLKKVHLYDNSLDAVKEQLSRDVNKYNKCNLLFKDEFHYITDKELSGNMPLNKIISEMKSDWFVLNDYESYPAIKVEMLERK